MEASSFKRSSQREEEINVCLEVNKKVCLNIKRSETIRNVKAMLCEKEGISECLQELFFKGYRLKDAQRLVDCGIDKNSTVQVFVHNSVPINLFIKMPTAKKTITVEVKPSDTIQNIKTQIREKEGVFSDRYTLISAGKPLDDNQTVECLNIPGGSTLHMLLNPKDKLLISVKMRTGEILKPEVKLLHTICDVKTILESMVGLSLNDMVLTYAGKQLVDSKTLSSLNIREESVLEMLPLSYPIFIKSSCGKTITFDVHQQDIIKSLKSRIFQKIKVPTYFQLMFEGKRLEDDRDLGSYNIQSDCTLHLVFWPSTLIRRTKLSIAGAIQDSTTINDLKKKIQQTMDKPVRELIVNGKALESQLTIGDYGIKMNTVIDVALEVQ
ncbi:polyubiquitin-like isoform X2 [Olea europaea var. sylvestris]|uniref:polyubiquitin-like isoform X2 n=1 Tax=Olea europaea var. sylvestris TaxID=158386 RepID=UPI000C1D1897|nr:polyubiquitin-like isoform X2 [Olea europaea var. sylvestris]